MENGKTEIRLKLAKENELFNLSTQLNNEGKYKYVCNVKLESLINKFIGWRDVNPRLPNPNRTRVSDGIRDTIRECINEYVFRSKGLLIFAESVYAEGDDLVLIMSDSEIHGLADGGNSYEILNNLYSRDTKCLYGGDVTISVYIGFSEREQVANITNSVNTNVQVKEASILNSKGYFDELKLIMNETDWGKHIWYKENEVDEETHRKKTHNVQEVTACLKLFNIDSYPNGQDLKGGKKQPNAIYGRDVDTLKDFRTEAGRDRIAKSFPLLKTVIQLKDVVYRDLINYCKDGTFGSTDSSNRKRKFTEIAGINYKKNDKTVPLYSLGISTEFDITDAVFYPILSAMRALVRKDSEGYMYFKYDPFIYWEYAGEQLCNNLLETIYWYPTPHDYGRNKMIYQNLHSLVKIDIDTGAFQRFYKEKLQLKNND